MAKVQSNNSENKINSIFFWNARELLSSQNNNNEKSTRSFRWTLFSKKKPREKLGQSQNETQTGVGDFDFKKKVEDRSLDVFTF